MWAEDRLERGVKMITIEEQKEFIKKQKELAERIQEYLDNKGYMYDAMYLGKEDYELIQRALACHMAVVTLDMKRRCEDDI